MTCQFEQKLHATQFCGGKLLDKQFTNLNTKEYKWREAYITIEDNSAMENMDYVVDNIIQQEEDCYNITCIEKYEDYCVLKIEYDKWEDLKDISATITYLLLQYGIGEFTFSCKAEELSNEYE